MMKDFPSEQLKSQLEKHNAGRSKAGMVVDSFDYNAARSALGDTGLPLPENIEIVKTEIAGVPCVEVTPSNAKDDATIVYIHGGGYCAGGWDSHKGHASWIAHYASRKVVFPDYRLAPEAQYPAAFEDGLAVVTALLASTNDNGQSLVLSGDSAGAGMCVAITRHLLNEGSQMPQALALLCGMFDLNPETSEYLVNYGRAREMAALYVGDSDPTDPFISPVFAELTDFPPMLIQIGGGDYIRDDGVRLGENAIKAGVAVVVEHWPKMPHVWQRFVPEVPEADKAIQRAAEFLASVIDS